jgi:hypothetical protein
MCRRAFGGRFVSDAKSARRTAQGQKLTHFHASGRFLERECGFFDVEITRPGRASQAQGAIVCVYAIDIACILHEGPPEVIVKIKSEIVINGSFERQKFAFSG